MLLGKVQEHIFFSVLGTGKKHQLLVVLENLVTTGNEKLIPVFGRKGLRSCLFKLWSLVHTKTYHFSLQKNENCIRVIATARRN